MSPPRGYFPDFLTPFAAADGFGAGLQAVLSTPKSRLRKEIGSLRPPGQGLGPQVDSIRQGDAKGLRELGASMEHYHQIAIAPIWKEITKAVHADRAGRARDLIDGGWTTVLAKLHPTATFQHNVLQIGSWAADGDRDLHLAGRGLLLIPSYFKEQRQLMVLADNELPPVLLYPIAHSARLAAHAQHLAALIGRTRTDVLEATTSSAATSAIAARVRVSLPSASKHLSVLRGAGLVQSVRVRNTVRHTATGLGRKLLAGTDT
jgi:DNA-binding transcriptional ArsR family regulator